MCVCVRGSTGTCVFLVKVSTWQENSGRTLYTVCLGTAELMAGKEQADPGELTSSFSPPPAGAAGLNWAEQAHPAAQEPQETDR